MLYYPSKDYLEAGKFKLSRSILKEKGDQEYEALYANVLASEQLISVNFGSIAIVCGVKSE